MGIWGDAYRQLRQPAVEGEAKETLKKTTPPNRQSTLHVVKETLLAFGGMDEDNQPTSDVLRHNPDTDSWEDASYMRNV